MISQSKQIDKLYDFKIRDKQKESINKRNGK